VAGKAYISIRQLRTCSATWQETKVSCNLWSFRVHLKVC